MIGSARSTAFRTPEGRRKAASELLKRNIDSLIVIGGDGSLTGADIFRQEWPEHVKVRVLHTTATHAHQALAAENHANPSAFLRIVGLVGSIDNDMWCVLKLRTTSIRVWRLTARAQWHRLYDWL